MKMKFIKFYSLFLVTLILLAFFSCKTVQEPLKENISLTLDSISFRKIILAQAFDSLSKGTFNYYSCLGIYKGYSASRPIKFVYKNENNNRVYTYLSKQYSPTLPADTLVYIIDFAELDNSMFIYSDNFYDPAINSDLVKYNKTESKIKFENIIIDTLHPYLVIYKFKHIIDSYCFIDYINPDIGLLYHLGNDEYGCFYNEGFDIHYPDLKLYYEILMGLVKDDISANAENDPCFK